MVIRGGGRFLMSELSLYVVPGSELPIVPSYPQRDWYFIAEQPAPAPHLARPEGRAALPALPTPCATGYQVMSGLLASI